MQCADGKVLDVNGRWCIVPEAPFSGDAIALPESIPRQRASLAQGER